MNHIWYATRTPQMRRGSQMHSPEVHGYFDCYVKQQPQPSSAKHRDGHYSSTPRLHRSRSVNSSVALCTDCPSNWHVAAIFGWTNR